MSGAEPLVLPPAIRAAILWDVPTLRSSGRAESNLLIAFGTPPWNLDESAAGPLQVAALGVVAANTGRLSEAAEAWRELLSASDPSHCLFGHLLRLWFGEPGEEQQSDLRRSRDYAAGIPHAEDRARIYRKIAVGSMDVGNVDLAQAVLADALPGAPVGTALGRSIRALLWELGQRSVVQLTDLTADVGHDDLVDQPWIADAAFEVIARAELDRFRDELRGVWSGTIRSGPTPLDTLRSLQRQADWAAAVALRDLLIQNLCTHLLSGEARSEAEVRWAATSWVLARGDQIPNVLRKAERAIDAATAHELVNAVATNPLRVGALPQVAASLWRHVDDNDVAWLLRTLKPGDPDDVTQREARQVWANLVWRDPAVWHKQWRELELPDRQGAIEQLHISAVDRLSSDARTGLLATCETLNETLRPQFAGIAIALALAENVDPAEWFKIAGPEVIRELGEWRRREIPEAVLDQAVDATRALVLHSRDEVLDGKISLGTIDARQLLGSLAAQRGRPTCDIERLLVTLASDGRMPAEHKMGALQGLVLLRHAGLLSDAGRTQVRALTDEPGPQVWGLIGTTVLRIMCLWTVADDLGKDELLEIEAACRSPQRQVRLVATAALGDFLECHPHSSAAWTIIAALYDPDDEVLTRALDEVRRGALEHQPDPTPLAVAAIAAAYRAGRNHVRRAAIAAAWIFRDDHPEASRLVNAARGDRSWEVRYAATGQ